MTGKYFSHRQFAFLKRFLLLCFALLSLLICSQVSLYAGLYMEDGLPEEIINNTQKLAPFLEKIYQESLNRGFINFNPYSLLLVKECYDAIEKEQYNRALILAEYSQKLSPDLPPAYTALARAKWSYNKLLIYQVCAHLITAYLKRFQNLESGSVMLSHCLFVLLGAYLLTLGVFCALSLIKYIPLAFHDFEHLIPFEIPRPALIAWALVLLLLPLFFNFSIFWAMLYWMLLLFNYYKKREQFVVIALLSLFAFIPWAISILGSILVAPQSPFVSSLWRVNYGYWNEKDRETLKSLNEKFPLDKEILFTLGLMNKKEKNYRTAEFYYKRLLETDPNYYKAYINLGNVYYATKRWGMAIDEYKRAISIARANSSSHFNLSRTYLQKFMFSKSESELLKAKKLDSKKVEHYLAIYSTNPNRLLIDEPISRIDLWKKAFQVTDYNLAGQIWDLLCRGLPLSYGFGATIFILFFALISVKDDKWRIAARCKHCGKAICKRCYRIVSQNISCMECINLFEKEQGIDSRLREKKIGNIERFIQKDQKITKILSIAFPGANYIWRGYPVRGTTYLFIFFLFVLNAICSLGIIAYPWDFLIQPSPISRVPFFLMLIPLWIFFSWNALALKTDNLEFISLLKVIRKEFKQTDKNSITSII